jgi:nitrogen regulatory protein P-II 1
MIKIEAIVRHHKVEEIKEALSKLGIFGMTVIECRGYGRQKGQTETYRGAEYQIDFLPKIKIEMVVNEQMKDQAMKAIIDISRTGQIGDGKIFVYPVSEVVRVRTGETGAAAI